MIKTTGFTLIESLVAIAVLMLVVSGASNAVSQGISSYNFSKNQIIAFYIAQEAIEQVRNVRDQNGLVGNAWLLGIANDSGDPCYFGETCLVDVFASPGNNLVRCDSQNCPVLKRNVTNGFYGYGVGADWQNSIFTRSVSISQISANEVSIIATVSWQQGPITKSFVARENILDWQ